MADDDQARGGQDRPGRARPGEARPGEARPGGARELPDIVIDHGDVIEVAPGRSGQVQTSVVGGLLVLGGLLLVGFAIVEPGEGVAFRVVVGVILLFAGALILFAKGRRLTFDADGVTLHRPPLPPRSLPWDQVRTARVGRRGRRPSAVGSARRRAAGGVTMRPDGGLGRGLTMGDAQSAREAPFAHLRLRSAGEQRDLTLDLNDVSVEDGRAILAALRERGVIPATVEVVLDDG